MFRSIREDIQAIRARDPLHPGLVETLMFYPGLHAIMFHRLSHGLWRRGWRFPARLFAHLARWLTGIEIHPGAKIGRRVFIDHGMGCVIGETAQVGDDVTLYHGATLGGRGKGGGPRRHPLLEAGVVVGAGAHVLGPIRIGYRALIGAGAVVLGDVPAGTTMVGVPARAVRLRQVTEGCFPTYGVPDGASDGALDDPDTVLTRELSEEVISLFAQVDALRGELEQLRGRLHARKPDLHEEQAGMVDLDRSD